MRNKKTAGFHMRTFRNDNIQIAKLARRLGTSKTDAVLRAVNVMLETTESQRAIVYPLPERTKRLPAMDLR